MTDDLKKRLTIKAGVMEMGEKIAWGSDTSLMREAAARIEELEAKLALSEGALDVASKSWSECQRILEQTEAKLAKCQALMHAGLAEYKRRLVMALEAMKFWSQAQEPEIDAAINRMQTTLAELEGELDD